MSSVRSFADAAQFLVNPRNSKPVPRRKIANNTYIERGPRTTGRGDDVAADEIAVVLHETAIVIYGPDYIRLNAGGWITMVTMQRIEQFTPDRVRIAHVPGIGGTRWYLSVTDFPSEPFYDGITLHHADNAVWYIHGKAMDTEAEDAHNAMIRTLLKGYMADLAAGNVPIGHAICGLCQWVDIPTKTGSPYARHAVIPSTGDHMDDQQHLIDHMIERVLPSEMERQALREIAGNVEVGDRWLGVGFRRDEALKKFLLGRLLKGAVGTRHGRKPVIIPTQEKAS